MEIKSIQVGQLETNCYILEKENEVLIIDPGDEFNKIKDAIKNKKVVGCLITHNHFDHVGELKETLNYYQLELGKIYSNKFNFEIINTPGHTSDSKTFYFKEENVMFVGDFIFYHSIGRTDLPTGSNADMKNSLDMISKYEDCILYPGHGNKTTLFEEKKRFSLYY